MSDETVTIEVGEVEAEGRDVQPTPPDVTFFDAEVVFGGQHFEATWLGGQTFEVVA
jgi:hypothetical protein